MTVVLAFALALALGLAVWWSAAGRPRSVSQALAGFGHAVVLGLLLCALVARLPSAVGAAALPTWLWLWPLPVLALAVLVAWRLAPATPPQLLPRRQRIVWWLLPLLALIVVRAAWLYEEAWLRPLFGWDAWLAWSAKARAWVLDGQALPFVAGDAWLADTGATTRTSLAFHYPELLSWMQVWVASASGGWNEPVVNLVWPTLWLALLCGCYGQWRALSVPFGPAAVGAYLLASLPLANVHAALPGYADLWVATVFAFAVLALLRWREQGEPRQLALALLLVSWLPLLKFEGMIWALGALALALWFALHAHPRWVRIGATLALGALLVGVSWWLELAWIDTAVRLFLGEEQGSGGMSSVLTATAAGLFTQYNWHLLWYLLPIVLAWRWREWRGSPVLSGLVLLVLGAIGLLLALFIGSHAGRWAESFTVVNRLVLQLAPLAITTVVVLLRGERGGTEADRADAARARTPPRA